MAASTGAPALLVNGEGQVTTTCLLLITLTGHVALVISQFSAANQGIAAEALPAVLSTSHAESFCVTISHAVSIGDLMMSNIGKSDAAQNAVAAAEFVREASKMRPSCDASA